MSVKEKFEQAYENAIESCSGEILEGVDFLLSACAALENSNEILRKRISALERENNILRTFYSENSLASSSADDIDASVEDLKDAAAAVEKIKSIIDTAYTLFEEISNAAIKTADAKNECDALLALECSEKTEDPLLEAEIDIDEIFSSVHSIVRSRNVDRVQNDSAVDDDEIFDVDDDSTEPDKKDNLSDEDGFGGEKKDVEIIDHNSGGESVNDAENADIAESKDDYTFDDITAKLKSMFGETDSEEEEDESRDSVQEDHSDISAMILKMLSEDFDKVDDKKNEPSQETEKEEEYTSAPEKAEEKETEVEETNNTPDEDKHLDSAENIFALKETHKEEQSKVNTDKESSHKSADEEKNTAVKAEERSFEEKRAFGERTEKSSTQKPNAEIIDLPDYDEEEVDLFADADEQESLYEEDRKQIKYEQSSDAYEKKEDIKSIKDSLARIKNKRKGV